jgi:ABC-2 type transport system permease protein
MVYVPAIWVLIGLSSLLLGWFKSLTGFVWLYLAFSFVVVYMGSLFQFPEWVVKLSPFGHIPHWPIEEMDFVSAVILTGIAILLTLAGLIGCNRRDIG